MNGEIYANDGKPIKLVFQKEPLSEAFKKIEKTSGYKIIFVYDDVKDYTATCDINTTSAVSAIKQVIGKAPLTYTEKNKFITISLVKENTERIINGYVKDITGEPLAGASVIMPEINKGVVTDINGMFQLTVTNNITFLKVTYVGMKPQTVKLNKNLKYDIVLEEDVFMVSDVVVTGYQTISKERSAGAYDIVKGENLNTKSKLSGSVLKGLEGLATGISINQSSALDPYIIRGVNSINSERSPLFVVDGIATPASVIENMINSNDISNITVLKDATAASIWGSQAGNGVIVITTKKGERNKKVQVSYDGSYTYQGKPDYSYNKLMNSADFMRTAQELFDEYSDFYTWEKAKTSADVSSFPVVFPHEDVMYRYKAGEISATQRDQMLQALIDQDGRGQYEEYLMSDRMFTQHNLSFRGGSNKHSYFLSFGYKGDQGISRDWSDNYTVNTRQDFELSKWLKWDVIVNASIGKTKAKFLDYDNTNDYNGILLYNNFPYNTFRNADGSWVDQTSYYMMPQNKQELESVLGVDLTYNPVTDFNRATDLTTSTNLRLNTGITINLLKGLKYEGRVQYRTYNSKNEVYIPQENYRIREEQYLSVSTEEEELNVLVPKTGGHLKLSNSYSTDWTVRNQLTLDRVSDSGDHQVTGLLGTEIRSRKNTRYESFVRGYNKQTMKYAQYDIYKLNDRIYSPLIGYGHTLDTDYYYESESIYKYFSLYANGGYTYLNKYTVNASIRMDQSNLFGSDPSTQYKPIWAVGAAWKLSEEDFMQNQTAINSLTIRGSYGLAGNSPDPGRGGKYDILRALSGSTLYENPGYSIQTPSNNKLTWEKTRTINAGIDIRCLSNRLDLSLDVYDKQTTDLIGQMYLNPVSGWPTTIGNLGDMHNYGAEIMLSTHNIKTRNFNWTSNLTLSFNKNKIEKLIQSSTLTPLMMTGLTVDMEGYPVGALFTYRYAGLDENGYPMIYDKDGNTLKGSEANNATADDLKYSGTIYPKWYGGFTNNFSYKNWDLSFMFVFNFGNHLLTDYARYGFVGRPSTNFHQDFDKRWRKPGDENITDVPRYSVESTKGANFSAYRYADTHIQSAAYVKLRDLSLGYSIPVSACRKIGVSSAKISAQVGNLFYIAANDKGIDPECYDFLSGRENKYGPTYAVGLNINF